MCAAMRSDVPNLPARRDLAFPARLVTFVNVGFVHMLANLIAHHNSLTTPPPLEVLALDDAAMTVCTRMLRWGWGDRCVRAPCCNASHGREMRAFSGGNNVTRAQHTQLLTYEAILMYKLEYVAAELAKVDKAIMVIDATSLVVSRACFEQWAAFPEAVVASAEPQFGCPPHVNAVRALPLENYTCKT